MTAPARTVLVTGCSSGIGAATAHLLAEHGWRVFATARTAADLGALGRDGLFPVPLDLANPSSVASAAAAVLGAADGRLDALVNNAGYCQAGAVEDLTRDALRSQFETNLFGVHDLTRALLPALAAARGRIVNVSSVFGRIAVPMTAAYCASKFALEALSDAMRIELAPRGIRVSIVEPGAIVSRFRKNAVEALDRNVDASASAYGPLYTKEIDRRRRQVKKPDFWTRPPEEAARAIAHALESSRPRRRYFVTPSARLVDLTVRFIPQTLTDRILRKRMPTPPPPSPSSPPVPFVPLLPRTLQVKYRPKHVAEYISLRALAAVLSRLPYRAALALAWLLARLAYPFIGRKRREAVRRIRLVMGEKYPLKAARRDAWLSFRNTAFTAVEMLYLSRHETLPVPVDMADALAKFRAHAEAHPGLGGIFACPHTGNWELAGIVAPQCGVNMFTITRDQKNPLVSRWLRELRHAGELELLFKGEPNLLRKVLANLRKGKYLAMMPDLRSKTPGVPVRIFGGVANTYPGLGEFSVQAKVPVFLAIMRRDGWTRHTMTLLGPWTPDPSADKKAEASRILQQVMDEIDRTVRAEPGQWFWYNSRWLLDPLPEGTPSATPSA